MKNHLIETGSDYISEFYQAKMLDSGLTEAQVRHICKSPFHLLKKMFKLDRIDKLRLEGFGVFQCLPRNAIKMLGKVDEIVDRGFYPIDDRQILKDNIHEYLETYKKFGEKSKYYTRKCDRISPRESEI